MTADGEKGWSQEELAQASGVSRTRIAALENHRAGDLGVRLLLHILDVLELDLRITTANASRPTLDDLMEEADAPRLGR